jgi:hypothetical protein
MESQTQLEQLTKDLAQLQKEYADERAKSLLERNTEIEQQEKKHAAAMVSANSIHEAELKVR